MRSFFLSLIIEKYGREKKEEKITCQNERTVCTLIIGKCLRQVHTQKRVLPLGGEHNYMTKIRRIALSYDSHPFYNLHRDSMSTVTGIICFAEDTI